MQQAGWAPRLCPGAVPDGCGPQPRKWGAWSKPRQGGCVLCGKGVGRGVGVGTQWRQETQTLGPAWGTLGIPPHPQQESGLLALDRLGCGCRVDHPCFPLCLRGGLAPGHGNRCGPSITHPSLVPFHSNRAAVLGLSPNLLAWGSCWERK